MKERTTQQVALYLAGGLLVAGIVIGLLVAVAIGGGARWLDSDQRALGLERDQALQGLRVATTAVTESALAGGLVGSIIIGLFWLERRSRQVYAAGGLFPLLRLRPGETLYDPNRAAGAILRITADGHIVESLASPWSVAGALEVQKAAALATSGSELRIDAPAFRDQADQALPAAEPIVDLPGIPSLVNLPDLFIGKNPSLESLVIGVGNSGPVSLPLHDLMHMLAVGASGWGKSTWLRSLIWQLAQVPEPVEVMAIDISGSEFNILHQWDRLRYPVARTTDEAEGLLDQIRNEIGRRKALWEKVPLASSLPEYNELTGEKLAPWICFADELTNLMNQGGVIRPFRETVQTARQYGLFMVVSGQSVVSSVIDTQTRGQFSTRLCFHAEPSSSRVVVDDRSAARIGIKGRAIAQLFGMPRMEIQGPYVSKSDLAMVLSDGGPRRPAPTPAPTPAPVIDETARRVWAMHNAGSSDTAIARAVFGYGNSHYIDRVRDILQQQHNG